MRRLAPIVALALLISMIATTAVWAARRGQDLKTDEVPDDAGFVIAGSVNSAGTGIIRIFANRDPDTTVTYETLVQTFAPYGGSAVGNGIRVALGDFDGDGNDELVTASGANTPVKVFEMSSSGTVGAEILSFGGFTKGAYVATGDINGDGKDELVTAASKGASPKVQIRSDSTGAGAPTTIKNSFLAYGSTFKGGVTVALGNTDTSGGDEVVTAPASGKGKLKVFHDADNDLQVSDDPLKESFFAYGSGFGGGVFVSAGPIASVGTGGFDLAVGPASGARKVRILTDATAGPGATDGLVGDNPEFESFFVYGSSYTGGVRVGQGDSDGSGSLTEVLTEPGTGAGSRPLKIYDDSADANGFLSDNPREDQFVAFPGSVTKGAFVAFGKVQSGVFTFPGLAQTIFDNSSTIFEFTVPRSAGIIRDLDVGLSIAHSFDSDLDVTLTHIPTGHSLALFTDCGHNDDGFIIRLSDESGTDICAVADDPNDHAVTGNLKPEAPAALGTFDGEDASGRWRLVITDDSASDSGTLFGWTLFVAF
jgi:subtilisin-like proprotein convertase family protein